MGIVLGIAVVVFFGVVPLMLLLAMSRSAKRGDRALRDATWHDQRARRKRRPVL